MAPPCRVPPHHAIANPQRHLRTPPLTSRDAQHTAATPAMVSGPAPAIDIDERGFLKTRVAVLSTIVTALFYLLFPSGSRHTTAQKHRKPTASLTKTIILTPPDAHKPQQRPCERSASQSPTTIGWRGRHPVSNCRTGLPTNVCSTRPYSRLAS